MIFVINFVLNKVKILALNPAVKIYFYCKRKNNNNKHPFQYVTPSNWLILFRISVTCQFISWQVKGIRYFYTILQAN